MMEARCSRCGETAILDEGEPLIHFWNEANRLECWGTLEIVGVVVR